MKRNYIKTSLLLVLFVGIKSNLAAQIETFELSDYKLPDLKRHGIDLEYNLSSGMYKDESDDNITNSYYKRKFFSTDLSMNYFFRRNTKNYQGDLNLDVYGAFRNSDIKNDLTDKYDLKRKEHSYGNHIVSNNRYYFSNLLYLGISPRLNLSAGKLYYEQKNYVNGELATNTKRDRNNPRYHFALPLSLGKGRIEPVEDARQTLYILEDLNKNGRLSKTPSHDEILQLASEISKIKNERIFDSRLKRKYELQKLDSILKDMALITEHDMLYFSSVNDMWQYGGLQQRSAGYRLSIEYTPSYSFNKTHYDVDENNVQNATTNLNETKFVSTSFSNRFGLNYVWEKPIKQKFQSALSGNVIYELNKTEEEDENLQPTQSLIKTDIDYKAINGFFNYKFSYYPNTRTMFSLSFNVLATKYWTEEKIDDVESSFEWERQDYRAYLQLRYYISPQLQMSINCDYSLYNRDNQFDTTNSRDERLNAWATFNYSIF